MAPVRLTGRLDHVGIATPGRHPLESLLDAPGDGVSMPSGVSVTRHAGVEFVHPERPGSPIERFLERRGPGLHHLALAVPAPLEDVVAGLREAGVLAAGEIAEGSDGRRTVFLHPHALGGVLVELVEEA
jgi:catechol 2,3-dioxygenase-like lactoylglutathione lyase family enzyme